MPEVASPIAFRQSGRSMAGRRVLITGASRGIAAAIARELAAEGATVGVNYCAEADAAAGRAGAAQRLAEEIEGRGGEGHLLEQDLMRSGGGTELVRAAEAAMGSTDTLVLSASVQVNSPFDEQRAEDLARQLRLNLVANIEVLQAVLPQMAERGFGRVLSIGSVQEVAPSPEMPIYAMTKAGLKNLIENLATQYAPHGVTLNTLSPGLVSTDRNEHRRADPAAWARITRRANPMGRAGTPEDLVGTALHLLSREAGFVTGSTVYATGGSHIPRPGAAARDG